MKRALIGLLIGLTTSFGVQAQTLNSSAPAAPQTWGGIDGSPQFSIGYTAGAAEYAQAVGGITGSGGSIIFRNVAQTGNVNGNFTAQGAGTICFGNNADGVLVCAMDPGRTVIDTIKITPSGTSAPGTIGGAQGVNLTGTSVQVNGSAVRSVANSYPVFALNTNGDFQIDQVNEGAALTATGSAQVIDGWRVIETQNTKLSYQQIGTSVFPAYKYSDKVNVVTQETIAATDHTEFFTQIMGPDSAVLQWGTAGALPIIVDVCLKGDAALTYPAAIPFYLSNGDTGGSYRYYIHLITLAAANTAYCNSIAIPGDTNASSWAQTYGNPGLIAGFELAGGANFQATSASWSAGSLAGGVLTVDATVSGTVTINNVVEDASHTIVPNTKITSQLTGTTGGAGTYQTNGTQTVSSEAMVSSNVDAWGTGRFYSTLGSTQLAALASGSTSNLWVGAVHVRIGTADSVYQPLPYALELARAQKRFWKTFAPGTKPAQNAGAATGEIQWDAQITTTGTEFSGGVGFPVQMDHAPATVTYYNPSATNGNCRDETAAADGGAPSAVNSTADRLSFTCAGNAGTAVGNRMGIHITVDSGQ